MKEKRGFQLNEYDGKQRRVVQKLMFMENIGGAQYGKVFVFFCFFVVSFT